jgi:phage shock protein E
MKTQHLLSLGLLAAVQLHAREIKNPAIEYAGFAKLTAELGPLRESRRISEEEFLRLAGEPGTVVFDARSRDKFERIHVKGALHLAFTDFTDEALQKVIPDKNTRILIYCNNNFDRDPVGFARKSAEVALNIQTFINLHAYGYKNVYELGPLLDIGTTKIPFEGTGFLKIEAVRK